jgi:hypothetical protein
MGTERNGIEYPLDRHLQQHWEVTQELEVRNVEMTALDWGGG